MISDAGMRIFLTYVLLGMPALGVASYFRVRSSKPLPSKSRCYLVIIVLQVCLLALTFTVASRDEVELFLTYLPSLWTLMIAVGYFAMIALLLNRAMPKSIS